MTRNDNTSDTQLNEQFDVLPLSAEHFRAWGLGEIAYIRPIEMDGEAYAGIFAADGEQLGAAPSAAIAAATAIQEGLVPVYVH